MLMPSMLPWSLPAQEQLWQVGQTNDAYGGFVQLATMTRRYDDAIAVYTHVIREQYTAIRIIGRTGAVCTNELGVQCLGLMGAETWRGRLSGFALTLAWGPVPNEVQVWSPHQSRHCGAFRPFSGVFGWFSRRPGRQPRRHKDLIVATCT